MADPPKENGGRHHSSRRPRSGGDLADEVERARTPRTPVVALTGVWLTVAVAVLLVLALAMTLYFVYGGR